METPNIDRADRLKRLEQVGKRLHEARIELLKLLSENDFVGSRHERQQTDDAAALAEMLKHFPPY